MDPYQNQRNQPNNKMTTSQDSSSPQTNPPSGNPNTNASDGQNGPQYCGGFTMITPNQSRRDNLTMTAKKEEEDLQRYREMHRPGPIHMNPERLGGSVTLAEARQSQMIDQRYSKLQKKLKRDEQEKKKKEEEEAELQKMKDIQRQKAERQEQRRQQEEQQRKEELQPDHHRVNDSFLQTFETVASLSQSATSSEIQQVLNTSNVVKVKKNPEEMQQEHKRVNLAFLDRLESLSRAVNADCVSSSQTLQGSSEKQSSSHLLSPAPMSGDGSRSDLEWPLRELMRNFSDFDRNLVEEILDQCNGNYQQAYELLSPD